MESREMKAFTIKVLVLGGMVLILLSIVVSAYNGCVRAENSIEAFDKDMQNVHANLYTQLKAQDLAVDKYGEMVINAIQAAISGRYGKDGVRGAMLWIQESNPSIDSKVLEKLQVVIEAGYNKFEASQRSKIDAVRVYKDSLGTFPKNIVASMFGFPRLDKDIMERIVTSATTKKDFATGELSDAPITTNKKAQPSKVEK